MANSTDGRNADIEAALSKVRSLRESLFLTAGLTLLFALIYWGRFEWSPQTHVGGHWALDLYLAASLLLLSFIDIRRFLLLDVLTLPMIAVGLAFAIFGGGDWVQAVFGAALGYGVFAGLSWAWRRWRGIEALGLGDAKLLSAGGAFCGASQLPIIILIGSSAALVTMLVVQILSPDDKTALVPFGPFLAIGIWGCWCFRTALLV